MPGWKEARSLLLVIQKSVAKGLEKKKRERGSFSSRGSSVVLATSSCTHSHWRMESRESVLPVHCPGKNISCHLSSMSRRQVEILPRAPQPGLDVPHPLGSDFTWLVGSREQLHSQGMPTSCTRQKGGEERRCLKKLRQANPE